MRPILFASVLAAFAGAADARPSRRGAWVPEGLETESTPSRRPLGVVLLAPRQEGRVWFPGGTFVMGSTLADVEYANALCVEEPFGHLVAPDGSPTCSRDEFAIEFPAHLATVGPFSLDRTEVRVLDYDRCVESGACTEPHFRRGDLRYDRPELPVTMVSWAEAKAYCSFARGRLPTEAEWEYAARGTSGRLFPWGNVYNRHLANHGSLGDDVTDKTDGFTGLAPVGSFPDGETPSGLFDMAGNVLEWVSDPVTFEEDATGGRITIIGYRRESSSPLKQQGHYARGGSYRTGAHTQRAAARQPVLPEGLSAMDVGVRCAYGATSRE